MLPSEGEGMVEGGSEDDTAVDEEDGNGDGEGGAELRGIERFKGFGEQGRETREERKRQSVS